MGERRACENFTHLHDPVRKMNSPQQPFSHLDASGQVRMVDVSEKPVISRIATAEAYLHCERATMVALREHALPKGDVLATARLAGIMAAKRTAELIPLCHALPLNQVTVDFLLDEDRIHVQTSARTSARTGVEMEALTAAAIAALTLYDMMKAVDKSMRVEGIRVTLKEKIEP